MTRERIFFEMRIALRRSARDQLLSDERGESRISAEDLPSLCSMKSKIHDTSVSIMTVAY